MKHGARGPVARDAVWGAAWGAAIVAVLLAGGGVWDRVNGGDLHGFFLPRYEYVAHTVRALRLPLWNRDEFCGAPLLATPQSGALYPPVLVLFSILPPRTALQALYGLHVLVLLFGLTIYLRHHEVVRGWVGVAGTLAVAGLFSGLPGHVGFDHPNFLTDLAWFPFLLLCAETGRIAALALVAAAQWLSGYPDFAVDGIVVVLLVTAIAARRQLPAAILGLGLGACVAAVQLLPLGEAVGESMRTEQQGLFDAFRGLLLGVHRLADVRGLLLEPYGVATFGLVAFAFVRPTRARVAWLAALGWALLALNPPFSLLYRLPPFSGLRFPYGWRCMAAVLLGCLAAAGADAGWRSGRRWVRAAAATLAVATLAHGALAIYGAPRIFRFRAPDYSLVEGRIAALKAIHARAAPTLRLLSEPEMRTGTTLRHDLPSATGYDPSLAPRRIVQLLRPMALYYEPTPPWTGLAAHHGLAALLGIALAVTPRDAARDLREAGFVPVAEVPPADVVLHASTVPRARLVHRVVAVHDESESVAWMLAHAGDAATSAVVDDDRVANRLAAPDEAANEDARLVVDEPEWVAVDVTVASGALLVLSDTYFPGWTASVDGRPVPVLRADHAFRGIVVEPGRHTVVFRYAPASLRIGAAVSVTALLAVATLALRRRGRRTR